MFLAGGGEQLSAPIISKNDKTVSWTAVDNASGYEVTVNGGTPIAVEGTKYVLTETAAGDYKITVKALGDGKKFLDSEQSNEVTITVTAAVVIPTKTTLAAPVLTSDGVEITWSAVEHATGYEVYVDGELAVTQQDLAFTLSVADVGDYQITVKAVSTDANYLTSAASNAVTVTIEPSKLLAPVVTAQDNVFTWQAINHAASYQVYVDGVKQGEPVTETTFTLNATEFKTYSVTVKALSSDKNFVESNFSAAVAYTKEKQPVEAPILKAVSQQGKLAKTITWDNTAGASAYEVYVNGELAETVEFDAEKETYAFVVEGEAGEYEIYVKAITADETTSLDAVSKITTVTIEAPTDLTKAVYVYNKALEERLSRYILGIADEFNKNSLQQSYKDTLNNHIDNYLCNMSAPADTTNSIYRKNAWQLEVVTGYDTTKSWVKSDYPIYRIKLTSGMYLSVAKNNLIGTGGDYVCASEYVPNDVWQYWQLVPVSADNELNDLFYIYNLGHCFDWNRPNDCLCDTSRVDGGAEFWDRNEGSPFYVKNIEGVDFPEGITYADHSGTYVVSNFKNKNLYALSNGTVTDTERQLSDATDEDTWTLEKVEGKNTYRVKFSDGTYMLMAAGYVLGTAADEAAAHEFYVYEVAGVKNGFKIVGAAENGVPDSYCDFIDGTDGQNRPFCYSTEDNFATTPGRWYNTMDRRNETGSYWIFTEYQPTDAEVEE